MKEPPVLLLRSCRELQERSAFLSARLMAQREPETVAEPNLVIDPAQVIPDNRLPDAELLSDCTVVEPLCHQLYDAKPAPAGFPGSVSVSPAPPHGQICLSIYFCRAGDRSPTNSLGFRTSGLAMQPISRQCSRECCFVLIIPIDSYCRQWQNDRPTLLCRGYQTVSEALLPRRGDPGAGRVASC